MRLWRTNKAANRPFPKISDDPVIDYLIMEAIALKANKEDREAEEKAREDAKRDAWKKDFSGLRERLAQQ